MMKQILIFVVLLVVVAAGGYFYFQSQNKTAKSVGETENHSTNLSTAVKDKLDKKLNLVEKLASNPEIISEVMASNTKNSTLTKAQISQLDEKWKATEGIDDTIKPFLTNKVARVLEEFQTENPGFIEMFIADGIGLNVGQTNKTSDYYQADEEWWVGCINNGQGKAYYGDIEYDESAKAESVALYVPVYNQGKTIGCIKAVLTTTAIVR